LLELLVPWVVAEAPGGMLLVGQSDDTSKDFAETRLIPVLNACPPVAKLFPKDRHQKRKTSILFPHMPLFLAGANISSLQEKSMRYVWMDEIWRYRDGMIGEAVRRTHDRWNSVVIGISQGWDQGHDSDAFFDSGELLEATPDPTCTHKCESKNHESSDCTEHDGVSSVSKWTYQSCRLGS